MLAAVDVGAWRRRDERARWAWSLWFAPAALALFGLGWVLDSAFEPSEPGVAAWAAMTAFAALGVGPSVVAACKSRGPARGLAVVNALALAALATRVVVFVESIELM